MHVFTQPSSREERDVSGRQSFEHGEEKIRRVCTWARLGRSYSAAGSAQEELLDDDAFTVRWPGMCWSRHQPRESVLDFSALSPTLELTPGFCLI